MSEGWAYAVLGRGRWARRMREILAAEGRRVECIEETRRDAAELTEALRASGAQVAWLCVTPGSHAGAMMRAAINAGMHAVAEKPWLCLRDETESLAALAEKKQLRLGVHFQYCLLDEVRAWRERFYDARGLRFGGRFTVSRGDRLGIPALENLGSHLAAIRRYAAPESQISELLCSYEAADERRVWIESESVDFAENRQPIIQRFIRGFEAAIEGAEFPFDLAFASAVAEDLAKWRVRQTTESPPR